MRSCYEIARRFATVLGIEDPALEGTETCLPRILPKLVREALFVFIDAHANVADPTTPLPLVIELDTLGRQLQQSGAFVLAHDFEHRLEPVSSQFDDGVELLALSPLLWAVPTACSAQRPNVAQCDRVGSIL